jgi:hypothetical protein
VSFWKGLLFAASLREEDPRLIQELPTRVSSIFIGKQIQEKAKRESPTKSKENKKGKELWRKEEASDFLRSDFCRDLILNKGIVKMRALKLFGLALPILKVHKKINKDNFSFLESEETSII